MPVIRIQNPSASSAWSLKITRAMELAIFAANALCVKHFPDKSTYMRALLPECARACAFKTESSPI